MAATIPAIYCAYRYTEHGKPAEVLQLRSDVPQTPLSASHVRVKVLSAAADFTSERREALRHRL